MEAAMNGYADLAIVNGSVLTMAGGDPAASSGAVAVTGGTITAVGREQVGALIGPSTRVVDAAGGAVLPGINDGHLHFIAAAMVGFGYLRVGVDAAKSWDEVCGIVERTEPGADGWIRAHGWDEVTIGTRLGALLDCRPGVPVVAFDQTGHQLMANRTAMERAGITDTTLEPAGGVIVRGPDGQPTGLFHDGAMELISRALPPIPTATLRRAALSMQELLHSQGLTSLTEPGLGPASAGLLDGSGSTAALELLGELAATGELTMRMNVLLLFAGTGGVSSAAVAAGLKSGLAASYTTRGIDPRLLRIAGVKVFADGIPRSGTAWMSEPYGDACTHGSLVVHGSSEAERLGELGSILRLIDDAGLQAGIHATGDAATEAAVEALLTGIAHAANRHYIIHGAFGSEATLDRMAAAGIGYSTNPLLRAMAGDVMRALLGEARFARHQPLHSALAAGVRFNLASDAPVTSTDWRRTVVAAVERSTPSRPASAADPERITGLQALAAMTAQPAWQDHAEGYKGTLQPGMAADLCLLGGEWPTDEDVNRLLTTDVLMTISNGRIVHDRLAA